MTQRRAFGAGAAGVFALLVALGLPGRAAAQDPAPGAQPVAEAVKDLPLTAEQRQAYVGNFLAKAPDGSEMNLRVFDEGGVLKGQPGQAGARRLLYQGDQRFRVEGVPGLEFVFVLEDGRATRFTFKRGNDVLEAVRVR